MGIVDSGSGAERRLSVEELKATAQRMRQDIIPLHDGRRLGPPGRVALGHGLPHGALLPRGAPRPEGPQMAGRDRIFYSKAHITPAIYSVMALSGLLPRG